MKSRPVVTALVLLFTGALTLSFAQNANMGTWQLNEAKSKIPAGFPKNHTVVYAMAGDQVKVTVDGTAPDGSALHTEWTGKFDGKDYPLSGDPTADMRSYKQVNDHSLMLESKKDGKVVNSAKIVVAPDGKTRTITLSAKDAKGMKVGSTAVYDRQ